MINDYFYVFVYYFSHPQAENKPDLIIMKLSSSIYSTVFFLLSSMGFYRAQKPLKLSHSGAQHTTRQWEK